MPELTLLRAVNTENGVMLTKAEDNLMAVYSNDRLEYPGSDNQVLTDFLQNYLELADEAGLDKDAVADKEELEALLRQPDAPFKIIDMEAEETQNVVGDIINMPAPAFAALIRNMQAKYEYDNELSEEDENQFGNSIQTVVDDTVHDLSNEIEAAGKELVIDDVKITTVAKIPKDLGSEAATSAKEFFNSLNNTVTEEVQTKVPSGPDGP